MKKDIKIAFFDIDWTLYDHGQEPNIFTKSSIDSINKLREKDIKVILCTARAYASMLDIHTLEYLNVDGVISHNGGFMYIEGKKVRTSDLDPFIVNELINRCEANDICVEIFTEFGRFITKDHNEHAIKYHEFWNEKYSLVKPFDPYIDHCFSALVYAPDTLDKVLFPEGFPYAHVRFFDTAVDVTIEPFYKGDGIKITLDHYGFSKDEAIAFGDSYDDVSMFKEVGTSVAMGNGSDIAKENATFVTKRIEEDGVEFALKQMGLI